MSQMRAVRQQTFGGPEVLRLEALPMPEPGPGQVLIEVVAAAINHYDILSRRGINPDLPLPRIPGIDATGRVLRCEADRPDLAPGTPVVILGESMGNGGPGGYASHVCIDAEEVFAVPPGVDLDAVACLGISYLTAWYALHTRAGARAGQTLYIPGVGGGVASAALQIAQGLGLRVLVSTGSAEKAAAALRLGAVRAIDTRAEDPVEAVRAATGGGANLVLNAVGGDTIQQGLSALRHGGRLLTIGTAAGREFRLDGYDFLCRELELVGVNISFHTPHERYGLLLELCGQIQAGRLSVLIDRVFALEAAAEAHRYVEGRQHFGKVVLRP